MHSICSRQPRPNSHGILPWLSLGFAWTVCLADLPDEPILWQYPTGGVIYSSATLGSEGTVYIGSGDNKLRALSADGTLKWEYETGDWVDTVPALSADGSTVYVGSWDNNFYAINAATGTLNWSFETGNYILASPAIGLDGTIYFGSNDNFFYALNSDGSLKWEYFLESDDAAEIHSSPAIGEDGTIYFGAHDGKMYALSPDGALRWSFQVESGLNGKKRIASSPALDDDGNLYFGSGNGAFYSLDSDGALRWSYRLLEESADDETLDSSPVVDSHGNVYFATREGYLVSLDNNGVELWSVRVGDVFYSAPLLDSEGNIYMVSYFGAFENEETGETEDVSGITAFTSEGATLWEYPVTYGYIDSSPTMDSFGILYMGASDGSIVAFDSGMGNGLASGTWPKLRNDLAGSGRASALVFGNEAPVISSGGGGATASVSVVENATTVTTVQASDPDGDTLTYALTGGVDLAKFTITASTGALSFASGPDFESPDDVDANNSYIVEVTVSDDGGLADTQTLTVTVTDQFISTELGGGWYASAWLGLFLETTGAWVYHYSFGWIYAHGEDDSVWLWFPDSEGWFWTSEEVFPFLYSQSSAYWIFFQQENSLFYHYGDSPGWSVIP